MLISAGRCGQGYTHGLPERKGENHGREAYSVAWEEPLMPALLAIFPAQILLYHLVETARRSLYNNI
jgi:hypothetical protein